MKGADDFNAVARHFSVAATERNLNPDAPFDSRFEFGGNGIVVGAVGFVGKNNSRGQPVILIVQFPRLGRCVEKRILRFGHERVLGVVNLLGRQVSPKSIPKKQEKLAPPLPTIRTFNRGHLIGRWPNCRERGPGVRGKSFQKEQPRLTPRGLRLLLLFSALDIRT